MSRLFAFALAVVAAPLACSAAPPRATCPPAPLAPPPPAPKAALPAEANDDVVEKTVETQELAFRFRASPLANLAYELDCLSDVVKCSAPAYRTLWKTTLHMDAADEAAIAEWQAIRKRYEALDPVPDPEVQPAPGEAPTLVPPPDQGFWLAQEVRIAATEARSIDDLRRLDALLLRPGDNDRTAAILARFLPRFEAYWRSSARADAAAFHARLVQLFEAGPLSATIAEVARFYAPELPKGAAIDFDLVVRPKDGGPTTRAEQIGSHAVIEVIPGEPAEERADVVSHELFHFFYNARAATAQRALARGVAGQSDPLAAVAYELLDESVATTLGNGLVAKRVAPGRFAKRIQKERGFYNDRAIDRVAKAMLPRAEALLAAKKTIDAPEFAQALLASTHEALDADLQPSDYLHSFAVAATPGFEEAVSAFEAAASVNNAYVFSPVSGARALETVRQYPDLSAMVLLGASDAGALAGWGDLLPQGAAAKIAELAKGTAPFVYTIKRGTKAYLFVLVAKDVAGMAALAEHLAHAKKIVLGADEANPR